MTARSTPRRLPVALALALTAVAGAAGAAGDDLGRALAEALRRARLVAPELGVHVVELASGAEVVADGADRRLVIASNTKLFTTAAALDRLGPGYLFETPLLLRGSLRGDTLEGDLAVLGSGDPGFSGRHHYGDPLAALRDWARRLRAMGVRRVAGDALLYHGRWEDRRIHPDWPRDQLSRCYEAPVDALSFNDGCVTVEVVAGAAAGRPARVSVRPDLAFFEVRNEAVTTSSARRHRIGVERTAGTRELVVTGRVYRHARPFSTRVAVEDPVAYFGAALAAALAEEGVELAGRPRPVTALPAGPWWRFAVHRSDLLTALTVINERSQNFYAESVLKTLGSELCGDGSWEAGLRVVREFAHEIGLEPGSFTLADGSGMSRENRFTARHLTRLLHHMARHELAVEFVRTLPQSGMEDHDRWRTRLAYEPYRGRVWAKTGSLREVSTLSGYLRATSGTTYVFSILTNGARSVYDARRAQDRIVRALVDHG